MNDTQPIIGEGIQLPSDARLIERWLPIAALGEEAARERRSPRELPPVYYLHVWWARRPLVVSRAAILASMLPEDADRASFMHALGVLGDPVLARKKILNAQRTRQRIANPYSYERAYTHNPDDTDRSWLATHIRTPMPVILDPTAGGGAIPFEAARLGCSVVANDLNPVAALILRTTVEWPMAHGQSLVSAFDAISIQFQERYRTKLRHIFPSKKDANQYDTTYLWARTIKCPYCDGLVPLSPNWRLTPDGTGVRIVPHLGNGPGDPTRCCKFEIVATPEQHSAGTVSNGDGHCPFPDCNRVIDGKDIREQAQLAQMGEQLYAVVFMQRVEEQKANKKREKWERNYRAATPDDDITEEVASHLTDKILEWEVAGVIPSEMIPEGTKTDEPRRYGIFRWCDMFNRRQLAGHSIGVETYQEMVSEYKSRNDWKETTQAAFVYLALSLDKLLNYNSRMSIWMPFREVIVNTFNRHDFAFCWSHAEMAPLAKGLGFDWAIEQTRKSLQELIGLSRPDTIEKKSLFSETSSAVPPHVITSCGPADQLLHVADASIDLVVMDPPYYDNVMYAELSDFFYVWLKRTAGHVVPELFTRLLTDKDNEAVANPAKFSGQKAAKTLAGRDYQERMARIFEECRRVLKVNGLMTLMFTHKATGAWDALTKGLMEANFIITASWPINTEAEGSLHIKNKSAANSTILLVCRPRIDANRDQSTNYWEDIEPLVARAVRARVTEFQQAGITGVDLYLACFGPALEEFSRHWPLRRGTPRHKPEAVRRRRQAEMFEEEWDPYAVTPEDALDAARREVKRWRLEQLTHLKANEEVDPLTSFFVLAWDAFKAPIFPYDEALRLGRAVGVDLDKQVVSVLAEKKGSDLVMWDSARRAAKGALGPADGSRSMIDVLHHAAHLGRTRSLLATRELLSRTGMDKDQRFFAALEAVLEVLPVGKAFSGIDLEGDLGAAGNDFEALENLRKLAFTEEVDPPTQLELWLELTTA